MKISACEFSDFVNVNVRNVEEKRKEKLIQWILLCVPAGIFEVYRFAKFRRAV